MRVLLWLVVVSVLLVAAASEGAPPPEPNVDDTHRVDLTATSPVPVFVYGVKGLSADDQRMVFKAAEEALATASVNVAWTVCPPRACLTSSPGTLKLRILVSPDPRRDSHRLGNAVIDSESGTGVLATVFIDRTRRLARDLHIDHRVLLGRTIAHELGHLLLASTAHASAGLMREAWSQEELLGRRRDDWVFDQLDAAAIRDRLARTTPRPAQAVY